MGLESRVVASRSASSWGRRMPKAFARLRRTAGSGVARDLPDSQRRYVADETWVCSAISLDVLPDASLSAFRSTPFGIAQNSKGVTPRAAATAGINRTAGLGRPARTLRRVPRPRRQKSGPVGSASGHARNEPGTARHRRPELARRNPSHRPAARAGPARASPSTRPARRSYRPADPRRPHLERASSHSRGKHLDEPMGLVDPRVKDLVDLGLETGETRELLPPGRGRGRSTRGGTGPFLRQDGLEQVLAHEGHDHRRQGGVVYHGCSSANGQASRRAATACWGFERS